MPRTMEGFNVEIRCTPWLGSPIIWISGVLKYLLLQSQNDIRAGEKTDLL